MNDNVFFFINSFYFKDYKSLQSTKHPFLEIYERFDKCYNACDTVVELIKLTFSNVDNKKLFYTGIEPSVYAICKSKIDHLNWFIEHNRNQYISNEYTKAIKIDLKDPDSRKGKRLIGIIEIMIMTNKNYVKFHLWIFFPIEYSNFHTS